MPPAASESPLLPLPPDEVHVWIVEPEKITEPRLLERYHALLDSSERERHQRFHFEKHRHQFLVSHALVRLSLSRYAPVPPEAWSFTLGTHGRPEVTGQGTPRLYFNLSHTDGMAICAVSLEPEVGADVEDTLRHGMTVEVADRFFAPTEAATLRALPEERQRERFFELWTLKEAYIKARGMGLSLPLEHFAFELRPGEPPRITFDPRLVDEPSSWRFFQLQLSARHQAALAVRRAAGLPLKVRTFPSPFGRGTG
ncbi:MAG TPA: 4'-phosphopantetheinyl transferase superfamily protein [Myxococcaceae bacterium]|jgi:4'-phosphopantetheinyl transferase